VRRWIRSASPTACLGCDDPPPPPTPTSGPVRSCAIATPFLFHFQSRVAMSLEKVLSENTSYAWRACGGNGMDDAVMAQGAKRNGCVADAGGCAGWPSTHRGLQVSGHDITSVWISVGSHALCRVAPV
jgi:hypothetical protein